ncbi:phosphohistidine phosphatase [Bifidobacterium minimum]|uniref:Phosphohistidine phosphatase n=1 Tax=Bifidobacterium minimum TaxID=1693 RepID=A0A087BNT0_9BIFI|nr:histidine phosphatase family protein [Bifidobacterium minimum]KFI72680.1 phosphohistidine phosphatase [Bifidobacterium minimum]
MGVDISSVARRCKTRGHVLIVMRHAKAEPGGNEPDSERALTDKGRKQAKRMARGLVDMGLMPDRIACSGAVRARQTLDRMLGVFGDHPRVDYRKHLYDGGIQAVVDELSHTSDDTRILLLLAHEPTVSVASQWLSSQDSDPASEGLLGLGMSVGSVAILTADGPFDRWQTHGARLEAVIRPKDLR